MNKEYKLIPLKEAQSIPISWRFNQDEYDKLVKGHRSNWCVFLRDDVVHFCRVGGEEFYSLVVDLRSDGTYLAETLQAYTFDNFINTERNNGTLGAKIEEKRSVIIDSILEEVSGLLRAYFDISVPAKPH